MYVFVFVYCWVESVFFIITKCTSLKTFYIPQRRTEITKVRK